MIRRFRRYAQMICEVVTTSFICAYLRHLRTTLDTKEGAIHAQIRRVARTDRRLDDADPVDRRESRSPFTNHGLTRMALPLWW